LIRVDRERCPKASEQFYAALNRMLNGDARPLADISSHGADVTTMHPIGGRQVGWDEVWQSWEQVAQLASGGRVTLDGQILHAAGDMAYELDNDDARLRRYRPLVS
jgi:ketosteroid isomerase-like protein